MRLVSLFPAATDTVCELGIGAMLVGRTHACDARPEIASAAVVTSPAEGSAAIPALDAKRLLEARPDVILAPAALRDAPVLTAPQTAEVVWLDPRTLEDVFSMIGAIGNLARADTAAARLTGDLRADLDRIQSQLRPAVHRPWVAALTSLDPPASAGHWIPEQIALAGGQPALSEPGLPPGSITWDDVVHSQPEMVVAMPWGMDLADSVAELMAQANRDEWRDMPATHLNQVYAVDAAAYFSRPGPRLVHGVEILAGLLHPDLCRHPLTSEALRLTFDVLYGGDPPPFRRR